MRQSIKPSAYSRAAGARAAGRAAYAAGAGQRRQDALGRLRAGISGMGYRGAAPGFAQVAAVVRGMGIRGETKSIDIPVATLQTTFATGNSNSQSLTLIQEGAGFWNRIGRKACLKSLQVSAILFPENAAGALVEELLRYIIFYDKQPNGVAATWNQVVQAYDNAGGVTNSVYDGMNLDNRDRFVILRDRKIVVPRTSATGIPTSVPFGTAAGSVGSGGSDGGAVIKEYIKLGGIEAQFSGTANPATVAQISTGNLAIVVQGGTGGQWQFVGSARLRFTDC